MKQVIDNGLNNPVNWGPEADKIISNFDELYNRGVHVEDYGAVGNGSTNDHAAIQQCINENDLIIFSPKKYKIDATILITATKTIYFNNCTLEPSTYIESMIRIESPTHVPVQVYGKGKLTLAGNNFAKLGILFRGGGGSTFDIVNISYCRLWGIYIESTTGNNGIVFNTLSAGFNGAVINGIGSYDPNTQVYPNKGITMNITNMTSEYWNSKKVYELLDNEFHQFDWILDDSGYNKNGAGELISSHRAFNGFSAVADIIDKTQAVATLYNRYGNWVNSDYINKPILVLLGGAFCAAPTSEGVLTIHNFHSTRNPVSLNYGLSYGIHIGKYVSHYDVLLVVAYQAINMHIDFLYAEGSGLGMTNYAQPWNSLLFVTLTSMVKVTVGGCLLSGTRQRTILDENVFCIAGTENSMTSYRPVIDVGYYSKMLGYENITSTNSGLRTYLDEYTPKILAYKRSFNTNTTNTITLDLQAITNINGNGFVPITIFFHKVSDVGTFRIGLSNNLINNGFSLLDGVNNKLEFDPSTLPERFKVTVMLFDKEFTVAIETIYANQIVSPSKGLIFGITSNTITENNLVGDTVGSFEMINSELGDTFTYSLIAGEGDTDNSSFTIDGAILKAAAVFDYETKSSYSIRVRSVRQDTYNIDKIFNINVIYDWQAITDFNLDNDIVSQNAVVDQFDEAEVGYFIPVGAEEGNEFVYELAIGLGDDDNESFRIDSDLLIITRMIDVTIQSQYSIRVRCTDLGSNVLEKVITIYATDQDLAPTDIQLSYEEISEVALIGSEVGRFTTTDPDSGGTFIYSLVAGTGDDNNASFTITGDRLYTAQLFDYETKSSYSIRVRTTDATGQFFEKVFIIAINEEQMGPNLVTNGTFDTDTAWTKETGVSIANGKAVFTSVPSGSKLVQSGVISSYGTYIFSFTVSDYVSGTIRPEIGFDHAPEVSANGSYNFSVTSGTSYIQFRSRAAGTTLKIDNVEVRKLI